MLKNAILIAGPTASGKSSLALSLAARTGGTVVNADSMQVYSVLSLLTARPQDKDLTAAPHRLYGHVHPAKAYSVGHWLADVAHLIAEDTFLDGPAIFVGGTGLYFRALTQGLSPMPDIPDAIRDEWRGRLAEEGAEALHGLLEERDPLAAGNIRAADGQRIVRALEVLAASGRSIASWQAETSTPLADATSSRLIVLEPERDDLKARINARFDTMVEQGALDEVRALLALGLDPAMPAMKAIGVSDLVAFMAGQQTLEAAIEHAKAATRQYAKRQATWFRHQLGPEWRRVHIGGDDDAEAFAAGLNADR